MIKGQLKAISLNLFLFLVSTILILLIAESFVRIAGYRGKYELEEKEQLDWQYKTKKTHNSMGYHDYEYSTEKPKGTFRIYVLGDSYTYGQGIKMTETYPKFLEKFLNEKYPSKHFEVINSSFLGLDTKRELERLKDKGLKLSPDMVILGYCLNDPSGDSGATQWREEEKKEKIKALFNNKTLLRVSHFYWFLKVKAEAIYFNARIFTRTFLKLYDKDSKEWKDFEKSFNNICKLTKENDIPLLVIIFPYFYQLNENYPFFKAHSMVKDLCVENNVRVLDLLGFYKGMPDKSLWVKTTIPANTHPNAKAHRIAAAEIFKEIVKSHYFKINKYLETN